MTGNDGTNIIADYSLVSGIWNLASTYLTPFLDQNLLTTRGSDTYYYMQDGLGSVRNLLDAQCSTLNAYDYYAFGEALSTNELINNRYRFTSREWDSGRTGTDHIFCNGLFYWNARRRE